MTPFMELQDVKDDEIIGMKSTSIKFKNNIILFVGFCYFLSSLIIFYVFIVIFLVKTFLR